MPYATLRTRGRMSRIPKVDAVYLAPLIAAKEERKRAGGAPPARRLYSGSL